MNSSIILAISLIFALVAIYKLGGDTRHYKRLYENEMLMNNSLWNMYKALADRLPRKSVVDYWNRMSARQQDGAIQVTDRDKLLTTARKRRASQKKYRDGRHANGEIQVFDDGRHLIWAKAADCAWIKSGKRWKRVLRSSKEFADYNMTGAVCYVGTMPHPEKKAA